MDQSGEIRTEAEGRELWLPYAMEFLRQANEIRMPSISHQNEDGSLVVIERQLIAIIRSGEVVAAPQRSSS
jgi:hypothetical protein